MPSFHHVFKNKSCFQRVGIISTQNVQRCVKEEQDYFRHRKQSHRDPQEVMGCLVVMFNINGGPVHVAGAAVHHLVLKARDHISWELWLTLLPVLLLQRLLAATGNHGNIKGRKHLHHCMPELPGTWSCDALWQCRKNELTWYSNLNGLLSSLRTYVPWQNTTLIQKKDISWWDCEAIMAIYIFFTE